MAEEYNLGALIASVEIEVPQAEMAKLDKLKAPPIEAPGDMAEGFRRMMDEVDRYAESSTFFEAWTRAPNFKGKFGAIADQVGEISKAFTLDIGDKEQKKLDRIGQQVPVFGRFLSKFSKGIGALGILGGVGALALGGAGFLASKSKGLGQIFGGFMDIIGAMGDLLFLPLFPFLTDMLKGMTGVVQQFSEIQQGEEGGGLGPASIIAGLPFLFGGMFTVIGKTIADIAVATMEGIGKALATGGGAVLDFFVTVGEFLAKGFFVALEASAIVVSAMAAAISGAIENSKDVIVSVFTAAFDAGGALVGAIAEVFVAVFDTTGAAWDAIVGFFTELFKVGGKVATALGSALAKVLGEGGEAAVAFKDMMAAIFSEGGKVVANLVSAMTGAVLASKDALGHIFKQIFTGTGVLVSTFIDFFKAIFESETLKNTFGAIGVIMAKAAKDWFTENTIEMLIDPIFQNPISFPSSHTTNQRTQYRFGSAPGTS